MDGNFLQAPGTSSSGDVSCSASETSAMDSSVSLPESSSTLISSPNNTVEITTGMNAVESVIVSVEHSSQGQAASGEGTPTKAPGSDASHPNSVAATMERINPFDQVTQNRNASTDSSSSSVILASTRTIPSSMADTSVPNTPSDSTAPIQPINSQSSRSSPIMFSQGTDGSSVPLNSVHNVESNGEQETETRPEDDNTEPSSAVTSSSPGDLGSSTDGQDTLESDPDQEYRSSISRFIGNARRRVASVRRELAPDVNDLAEDVPDIEDDLLDEKDLTGSLICGYLQKLGRNGKWQTRWFESDGECLSYYKSHKRTKVLATLDLEKVGSIVIDPLDSDGVSFNIQVLGRLYYLRSDSRASCKDWVITLNRVKEARMQQGNVKLVNMPRRAPFDLLDTPAQSEDFVAPRVVVLANRQRTRAVEEEHELNQLMRVEENEQSHDANFKSEKRLSTIGTVVLARWTKRKSSLSRLQSKLTKWALSLRRLSCTSTDGSGLDRHVHPPGHDDKKTSKQEGNSTAVISSPSAQKNKDGLSGWIGKEATLSSRAPQTSGALSPRSDTDDIRPRKNSSASDLDARVLS